MLFPEAMMAPCALVMKVQCGEAIVDQGWAIMPHGDAVAIAQLKGFKEGGTWALSEEDGFFGEVGVANEAKIGLVESIKADDIFFAGKSLCQFRKSVEVVALQVILSMFSAHFELGAEVIASKKDGKHGRGGQTMVVGWPRHARKGYVGSVFENVSLVRKSGTARMQLSDVEADDLQCPRWSTISSCPS